MLSNFVLIVLATCGGLFLTPLVRSLALCVGAIDRPGERKVHTLPIPRMGGLAVVLSALLAILVGMVVDHLAGIEPRFDATNWAPILLGGALVFLVGLWDDIRPVPAGIKLVFQAMAAGVAIWFGILIERVSLFGTDILELGALAIPLTFLWIVGITNAFNLVDGLDGLAAGLASISAGTSAVIFILRGDSHDALFLLILLGALLGFLRYNFNPATIFLGDSGSLFVGYVLAVAAITGSQKGATALAVVTPLLIFGLPIVDTLLSMVRRFVSGLRPRQRAKVSLKEQLHGAKRIFEADQGHIHHRLIALGFSHRNAVLILYSFAVGLSALALISVMAQYRNAAVILIVFGLATYIGVHKLGYKEIVFLKTGTLLRWYEHLSFNRLFFLAFADMVLIFASYWGSFLMKYDVPGNVMLRSWYTDVFPLVMMSQLSIFASFGLYRGLWRAMGIGDLIRVGSAVSAAIALSYSVAVVSSPPDGVFAFFCINFFVLGALVTGARSAYRVLDYVRQRERRPGGSALIYGAGRGGELVLQELLQNSGLGLRPVGFLDDKASLRGRTVNRVPVLGSGEELASVLNSRQVTALIISSTKIGVDRLRKVVELCREQDIAILRGRVHLEPLAADPLLALHPHALAGCGRLALPSLPNGRMVLAPSDHESDAAVPAESEREGTQGRTA